MEAYDSDGIRNTKQKIVLYVYAQSHMHTTGLLGCSTFLYTGELNTSNVSDITWRKNNILIARLKQTSLQIYRNNTEILPDGTLRIDNIQKHDEGDYTMEAYDSDGIRNTKQNIFLIVTGPMLKGMGCWYLSGCLSALLLALILFLAVRHCSKTTRCFVKQRNRHEEENAPSSTEQDERIVYSTIRISNIAP
ncbi:CD2 protein, partial [Polypterus senegalus]|nr:CD2 protein [Polypterus senegalus]